jgi:PKD repeat protein
MIKRAILFILGFACLQTTAQTVTTFGGTAGTAGGVTTTTTLPNATFNEPYGIVIDGNGKVYITEQVGHRIRLYDPANSNVYTRTGAVSDPANGFNAGYLNGTGTNARFNSPLGMAVDANNDIFVCDQLNHCIRKVTRFVSAGSGQIVTTFAGEAPGPNAGTGDYVNGNGTAARFDTPMDIVINANGDMYVADGFNDCIRKITPTGDVSLIAGTPGSFGFADGAGASAKFNLPVGLALQDNNTLLVADAGNRRIRSIDLTTNMVSTIAGDGTNGGDDGAALSATFASPNGLAVDAQGNIFVADGRNGQANTIRKISAGQVTTIAGTFNQVGTTDGQATASRFSFPGQMAFNSSKDEMLVTDVRNHTIRKINLKPVADFSTFNTNINVNVEVTLNNTSLNDPTTYAWEITPSTGGYSYTGGTSASSKNPKVTFTQTGSYTVKLTVTNAYGTDVETKTNYINVSSGGGGNAPIADFEADKTMASTNDTVRLTDKSTNNPNQWDWTITPSNIQYVDGTSASSQNPKIQFTQNGIYTVALKVTNPLGDNTKTIANYISVNPLGVTLVTLDDLVSVYPNPTSGKLTVDLGSIKVGNTLTVAVFDATGKAIYEQILFNNPGKIDVNLENQAKGIYFVTVYDGTNKVNKTVVVQ